MIGKPYSGKPNVRFDEGELEIEPSATTPALYSTESVKKSNRYSIVKERSMVRNGSALLTSVFLKSIFDRFYQKM